MKSKIYLMIIILCTMFSCAEEGSYRLGKFETSIEARYVMPESAEIYINFPKTSDNLFLGHYCYAYLTATRINDYGNHWRDDYIYGHEISTGDGQYSFYFENLKPDTEYHLMLETGFDLNEGHGTRDYYNPDFSFTSAKAGDYSALGGFSCDIETTSNGYTVIKNITLPPGLEMHDRIKLLASTSKNMTNAIEAQYDYYSYREGFFYDMQPGTYYLALVGIFKSHDSYNIGAWDNPAVIYCTKTITINQDENIQ